MLLYQRCIVTKLFKQKKKKKKENEGCALDVLTGSLC